MSLALGAYLFTLSIEEFMINDLKSINEMANVKSSELDIFKNLAIVICTHGKLKQLSEYQISMELYFNQIKSIKF